MCAARTRWLSYNPADTGVADDGKGAGCRGTRGSSIGVASVGDIFTVGPTSNKLYLDIDGVGSSAVLTLYSGTNLDPRFIARDITEKLRDLGKEDISWDQAECRWENAYSTAGTSYGNRFKLYSGSLGTSSTVTVNSGIGTAHINLGWGTSVETPGLTSHSQDGYGNYGGDVTVSGTYLGFMDETYRIVITTDNSGYNRGIGTPTKGVSNTYDGTITTAGAFNNAVGAADVTYTISIDTANGSTAGAGTGNVPLLSWTSTGGADDSVIDTEILYANHWYNIGSKGLMVKFTDAVFSTVSDAWTIVCYAPDFAQGTNASAPVGLAQYTWASNRGDSSASPTTTTSGGYTALGSRGLMIKFNPDDNLDYLQAGNEFTVICSGPKPSGYNIASLNYGNVTVSTESDIKCVQFEVESGAVEMSTVKFGLQSHGTFTHHEAGNLDTLFRFGTVGPANNGIMGSYTGVEWWPTILPIDIDNDISPDYLYSTKANLLTVSNADDSETVGSTGLMSDPIYINIRLGTAETGANSTINNRLYFDFS